MDTILITYLNLFLHAESRAHMAANIHSASQVEAKDNFLKMFKRMGVSAALNVSGILASLFLKIVINLCNFTQKLVEKTTCDTQLGESTRKSDILLKNQFEELKMSTMKKVKLIFNDQNEISTSADKRIAADLSPRSISDDKDDADSGVTLRIADVNDTDLILLFIKELARFEEMEDSVIATSTILQESLFPSNPRRTANAEVIILEVNGVPAGFTLYFYNFSTFLGKYGMYIEDLYVRSEYRGKGYGTSILKNICQRAVEKNCGRVEWWCLDWNERAIKFYLGLGAEAMSDWTVYRLSEDRIREIATEQPTL